MLRIGINRALWLFGVVQLVTIIGFVILSTMGNDKVALAIVISMEYLGVGLGTAAFTAFIASVGFIVDSVGWTNFFIFCTVIAIPGMLLLFKVAPWNEDTKVAGSDDVVPETPKDS